MTLNNDKRLAPCPSMNVNRVMRLLVFGLLGFVSGPQAFGAEVDFERQIRPLFREHCYDCHGPDTAEGGLRLDSRAIVLRGGDSGDPAIVPGHVESSHLMQLVTAADDSHRMPPEDAEPRLSDDEVEVLRVWIVQGANWPESLAGYDPANDARQHWSFQPILPTNVPCKGDAWIQTPVDGFVLNALRQRGLQPAATADPLTMIRRLYLVLTGVPPTPNEVSEFVADRQPTAVARLVDRLLTDPRYGERWAQHWLDVVRYADTDGFEVNTPRPNAWPYRDYVIDAFNQDKPYDQFVREQLIGDQLGVDPATGFLVSAAALLPGQIGQDEESKLQARQDELDEMIVGVGGSLLGLTLGCARCHHHKFDPITQHDYYSLQAVFSGVLYGEREWSSAAPDRPSTRLPPATDACAGADATGSRNAAKEDTRQSADTAKQESELPKVYAGQFTTPQPTYRLQRGDIRARRERVEPNVIRVLGSLDLADEASDAARRVALADWIASDRNPLTARVIANRLWHYHFGTGLVDTPSDFGAAGGRPSHPELLDYLASELIRSGWSLKHLHRLIVLSSTFQQAATYHAAAAAIDADNRWLWRYPTRRLEAEAIRDTLLSVSGELNTQRGGPGFSVFESRGGLNGFPPIEEFGPEGLRRMVYVHKIRMEPDPVFGAFDTPDAGQSCPKRNRSTTALQALNLFNSPFVQRRAAKLALRIQSVTTDNADDQICQAFQWTLSRKPSPTELQQSREVVEDFGLPVLCRVLFNTNEFLFIP